MATLFNNIGLLVNAREEYSLIRGKSLGELPVIENAYLVIEEEDIVEYGPMSACKYSPSSFEFNEDCTGKYLLPSWCDSHTHLVFAGSRENEFTDRIKGLSYAEIAARGGGILNSAKKLNQTSEKELFRQSSARLQEVIQLGTGAIEIKSGYGLTVQGELKMLRVIKRLKECFKIPIKATFLAAHSYPEEYRNHHEAYIDLIINEMLPIISKDKLADYIDVFCEKGFFSPEETEKICKAGISQGLKPRIHANQLGLSGGVQKGVHLNAISVDHLEHMDDETIEILSGSSTIGTLLPTAAFFLREPYPPARKMIEKDCSISIASDYNPGSSPSGNMNFVLSLACIHMGLLPAEAINAATLNGAHAMEVADIVGSITVGKKANLIITKKVPSLAYLPYAFGSNLLDKVMLMGEWI